MQRKCTENNLSPLTLLMFGMIMPVIKSDLATETHHELLTPMTAYSLIIFKLICEFYR